MTIKTLRVAPLSRAAFAFCAFLPLALSAETPASSNPPPGFEKVDQTITIATVPAKMQYDHPFIIVKPGARVALTLANKDDMQHNLVICRPGKDVFMAVAQAAWALGPDAIKKQFIPDHPDVLFHTPLVNPHESATLYFKAPEKEGDYPYVCTMPGHAALMNGTMKVVAGAIAKAPDLLREIAYRYYKGTASDFDSLEKLTPASSGKMSGKQFSLEPAKGVSPFAIVFKGILAIPADGDYTFGLSTTGSAELLVDSQPIASEKTRQQTGGAGRAGASASMKLAAGDHTVELHYISPHMERALEATISGGPLKTALLTAPVPKMAIVTVTDKPIVMRVLLPNASPAAMAVGMPGGFNYCFDVTKCAVNYAWRGPFLDVGPNLNARGGKVCEPLGEQFSLGGGDFPLRIGANDQPRVNFIGYRMRAVPEIMYSVDGVEFMQTVEPAAEQGNGEQGVLISFTIKHPESAVRFILNAAGLRARSSAGSWSGGTLTVPSPDAWHFTVTLLPQTSPTSKQP